MQSTQLRFVVFRHSHLDKFLQSAYTEEGSLPKFSILNQAWDWKSWLANRMHNISGHSEPHVFHFFKNADGVPVIRDKAFHTSGEWSEAYQLLSSMPSGEFSLLLLLVALPSPLMCAHSCMLFSSCCRCSLHPPTTRP